MSNRQARIARKAAQKAGIDAYVHLKPNRRELQPVGYIREKDFTSHINNREVKRREKLYGKEN